ncbi:MAG: trehalose-phosphatase, partial [Nitrospirae bacterium]
LLRKELPDATIAHFWHIPWPDWSVFRVCPQARELVEGLLGSDLLGFQIPLFVRNFIDCVRELIAEAEIDMHRQRIIYNGHVTQLRAYPISIDFDKFNSEAGKKSIGRVMNNIRAQYGLREGLIGLGVDRLEYTKALIKRLQAIELFFEKYKSFRGRFSFVQIVTATRMKEPYLSYKKAVEDIVERINRRFSKNGWKPIVYIEKKLSFQELVAFYRMADVGIISSIYDGMNLVSKEFIASQVDCKGVLILSELAGAAEELDGALLINPYDVEGFAEKIHLALKMRAEEKEQKMKSLREHIRERDIYRWITDILNDIIDIASFKNKRCTYLMDYLSEVRQRIGKPFFFLDYDGTLTPIVESPDLAVLDDEMRDILESLKNLVPVAIISGRSLEDLRQRVGIDGLLYAGNHGAEISDGERVIVSRETELEKQKMTEVVEKLKDALSDIEGLIIEDKGITTSIHFRKVKVKDLKVLTRRFHQIMREYNDIFRITTGKKVFEIRPLSAWNKGEAVEWILQNYGHDRVPIYIGDDVTDEDAFRALEGKGISIGVGLNCGVDYFLKDHKEVKRFLREVVLWLRH